MVKVPTSLLSNERQATKLQNAIDIEAFGKYCWLYTQLSHRSLTERRLDGLMSDCIQSVVCADLSDDD